MRVSAIVCVLACALACQAQDGLAVRVATFNLEDVRTSDLADSDQPRLRRLGEVIQRIRPTVILLNEIAYDLPGGPDVAEGASGGHNGQSFATRYLGRSQGAGLDPLHYKAFMALPNTGMPSGFDLDHDGRVVSSYPPAGKSDEAGQPSGQTADGRAYGGDSWGFGTFPGQYAMALLVDARAEILVDRVRTFRLLPWDYMPGAMLPTDPATGEPWYTEEQLAYLRLSSKSHWDVPVRFPNGSVVHFLCSHPTPPAFDGPEHRNGMRNHDEIRFWADYIDGASWIVDDAGKGGGLERGALFVILGDLNADPDEGSSIGNPIGSLLLRHKRIQGEARPVSTVPIDGLEPDDTAHFGLRVDYVLPSVGLELVRTGIWRHVPNGGESFPSDHYPVWADLVVPGPAGESGDE